MTELYSGTGLADCLACGETALPVNDGCQDVCSSCRSERIMDNPHPVGNDLPPEKEAYELH